MSEIIARRCYVSGRVQGVFYRACAREKAEELGCLGHARNLRDGRVEVLAVGEPAAVHALVAWLWEGSAGAQVQDVQVQEVALEELPELPQGFAGR